MATPMTAIRHVAMRGNFWRAQVQHSSFARARVEAAASLKTGDLIAIPKRVNLIIQGIAQHLLMTRRYQLSGFFPPGKGPRVKTHCWGFVDVWVSQRGR